MTLFELVASLTLDTKDFSNAVTGVEAEGKTLAQRLGADADSIKSAFGNAFSISIGQLMADGFKAALGAAWDFTTGSVEAASNLVEIKNVVDTVFKDKAGEFDVWAKNALYNFGMGEMAAKSYASTLASVLEPDTRGFNADEVYNMSIALTELIGDLASFRNMDFDTVFTMIMSGLRGETESIEQLGIDMRVASLAAFAGYEKPTDFSAQSDYVQTMIRFQYIMSATNRAQGDFKRTQDTYANQQRLLEENLKNLQVTLGNELLPMMTTLVTIMNDLFMGEESVSDGVNEVKDAFAGELATAESTATKALALVEALEELEKTSEDAASSEAWSMLINELERNIPGIGDLINEQTGKIEGGAAALRDYIDNWKELAITASKQKALQSLMEEYNTKSTQLATLINEQMVADKLEVDYAENQKKYEQAFADTIVAGMKAKGFDQETIDDYLKNAADLGAGMTFGQILMGESVDSALAGSQLGFGQSSLYSLLSLWEAGGGTKDSFTALATAWGVATTERNKYEAVNNAEAIAELEAFLQSKETELDALASILDVLYGDLYDTPEATSETPAEEPKHWSRFVQEEFDYLKKMEASFQETVNYAQLGLYTVEDLSTMQDAIEVSKTKARVVNTDEAKAIVVRLETLYNQAILYAQQNGPPPAEEPETAAEETAAEVAAAADEAATAAQQVTETAAQMTADANSTDAMLITVLQGLPGNIATAVGGMSVTLDGDTIVGYVSAAMAREARGSQNTGG